MGSDDLAGPADDLPALAQHGEDPGGVLQVAGQVADDVPADGQQVGDVRHDAHRQEGADDAQGGCCGEKSTAAPAAIQARRGEP